MAKNWKKIGKTKWWNSKRTELVVVKRKGVYIGTHRYMKIEREFRTKSEALAFARSYMRRH